MQALDRLATVEQWLQADQEQQESLVMLFLLSVRHATAGDMRRYGAAVDGHHIFAVADGRITARQMTRLMKRRPPQTAADLERPVSVLFFEALAAIKKVPPRSAAMRADDGVPVDLRLPEEVEAEAGPDRLEAWLPYLLLGFFALLAIYAVVRSPGARQSASGTAGTLEPIPGLRAIIAELQERDRGQDGASTAQ